MLSLQTLKPNLEEKTPIEHEITAMVSATDRTIPAVITGEREDIRVTDAIAIEITIVHPIAIAVAPIHRDTATRLCAFT
ncbi:hypothetical protein A6770_26850 [Nostoc minutum NIES-26]|uniref:Uncharacterized protein n=1 Tax=Nostoc minutum NIES-26 TaxID=1844469 RepID=A0A367QR39_9NOSO|nr:hypothetical protein A6770_26850 [Nostoc minutum NIES-26]